MMTGTYRESENLPWDRMIETFERSGHYIFQDLYDEETHPNGMPHNAQSRDFDASIEEVLHLVTNGYVALYPDRFSFRSSDLTKAMDVARGG